MADFATYARTVVAALGDRVTYWTTFNEPNSICSLGFGSGQMAPGAVCNTNLFKLITMLTCQLAYSQLVILVHFIYLPDTYHG